MIKMKYRHFFSALVLTQTMAVSVFSYTQNLVQDCFFQKTEVVSNSLCCTYYDFSRARSGSLTPWSQESHADALRKFFLGGWRRGKIARYYRAPPQRYTQTVMIPPVSSSSMASAFDEELGNACNWVIGYQGKLMHREGITFRFRGTAADLIAVRVREKIVFLAGSDVDAVDFSKDFQGVWESTGPDNRKYVFDNKEVIVGDWITLLPGESLDIDIIFSDVSDESCSAILLVEVQGEGYKKNEDGAPILPLFQVAELSSELQEEISLKWGANQIQFPGGPIFNGTDKVLELRTPPETVEIFNSSLGAEMRAWTGDTGQVLEARFKRMIGDHVILLDASGKQKKVPLKRLSAEDQALAKEMADNYNLLKVKHLISIDSEWHATKKASPPLSDGKKTAICEYGISLSIKQPVRVESPLDLKAEFYVLAQEGDALVLVASQVFPFKCNTERKSPTHQFVIPSTGSISEKIFNQYQNEELPYLVVITDGIGRVLSHKTTDEWLYQHLSEIRSFPVGSYIGFDGTLCPPDRSDS